MNVLRGNSVLVATVTLVMAAAGCSSSDPTAPPTVYYGQDVCVMCGMIISDERFAAAMIVDGDRIESRLYDDIGCLLDDDTSRDDATVVARWVHDFRTLEWRDAVTATYVHSTILHSPMAFGLAAVGDSDEAGRLLEQYPGESLDFQAVRARFEAGELVMHWKGKT